MKLDIEIDYSTDVEEFVAAVCTPENKYSGLVGWGSTEDEAVRDLQGALREHAVFQSRS